MPEISASGPNAEQIKYWNERGQGWVQLHELIDQQLRPLGLLTMERGGISPGQRVLDVGCGCGDTTVALAQRVGAAGAVVGIDVSVIMLQRARERVASSGLTNVTFANADAQTQSLPPPPFDVVFSRFGVMFFVDPAAAFANLRAHLRSQGRLAFVCWQAMLENPWLFLPLRAAAQHIQLPPPPAPDAPGPFAFADRVRVEGILAQAGFESIGFESVKEPLAIAAGGGVEAAADLLMQMGPTAQIVRNADPSVLPPIRASIREALAPYATARGVEMPSAAWIVTATAP